MLKNDLLPWLKSAMDLSYKRHTVLSGNIANVDTPGFVPSDVEFQSHLESALQTPEMTAETDVMPSAQYRAGLDPSLDENRVDVDEEFVKMTANRIFYSLASEVYDRKTALIKYAIDEGGRG